MARRPRRPADSEPTDHGTLSPRDLAIDALMALLAERQLSGIGLDDIAKRAGLSLSGLRAAFPGKLAILTAFSERIDLAVLAAGPAVGESERDRLLEVLMRRFDALGPYRPALRRLARNPGLVCAVGFPSGQSMRWMLAAAGIQHGGLLGRVATSGAGLVFAEAMNTWLRGEAPDRGKTVVTLDRALRRGERAIGYVRDACNFLTSFRPRGRRAAGRAARATG